MYFCKVTEKMSKPGEKLNKIVVKTREKVYYSKIRNEETGRWEDVEVGRGTEIVEEWNVSDEGLRLWNEVQAAEKV